MTPEISHTTQDAASEGREVFLLVAKTVDRLAKYVPHKTRGDLAAGLRARLKAEQTSRDERGLNHWPDYAPGYVEQLIQEIRKASRRRRFEARSFYKARHRDLVRHLERIVRNRPAAETLAADTYKELLEGKTTLQNIFWAATTNARNYLEKAANEQAVLVPLEEAFGVSQAEPDELGDDGHDSVPVADAPSQRRDDKDPAEVLVNREEEAKRAEELEQAIIRAATGRKYRWIREKVWWKDSGISAWAKAHVSPISGGRRNCK